MEFFGLSNIGMNYCIASYYYYTIRLSGFLLGYAILIIYVKKGIRMQKKANIMIIEMFAEYYWMNYICLNYWDRFLKNTML